MKFASYTEETIWSVEDSEEAARTEGLALMEDMEVGDDQRGLLKVAPIADALVQALTEVEDTDEEVLFELIDGVLEMVEEVDEDGEEAEEEDDGEYEEAEEEDEEAEEEEAA
ncbi:MAG: hypothetical protein KDJ17_06090 [Hyphomicrobiaceae bacterium]|nr:hypothetical protein [Hyphomicrobiaceae bacterium]